MRAVPQPPYTPNAVSLELFKFAVALGIELIVSRRCAPEVGLLGEASSTADNRTKSVTMADKSERRWSSAKNDQFGVAICGDSFGVAGAERGAADGTDAAAGVALGFTAGALGTFKGGFAFCIVSPRGRGRGNGCAP
jgi:hypothetical protein